MYKRKITLISLIILFIGLTIYFNNRSQYSTDENRSFVRTKDGRITILHGMNILTNAKAHPLRIGELTKEDITRLSSEWGFNAVRLLIFWDGIEPEKGKYDYDYLDRVKERLNWCEEAGLKVILDMHQDLYAVGFGGDGAPKWAIKDDDAPFTLQTPWELNYFEDAVQNSIANFWEKDKGHPELQEHFINSLLMAVKYLGNHPTVIGIDLYNEPTHATLHGFFNLEEKYLTPFYQKIINKIREIDNNIWIYYEPQAFGPNQGFQSKLGLLKDPRKGDSRLVYFPHIYTLDLDINGEYMDNTFYIDMWANARQKEYQKQNVPMLIGEFGLKIDSTLSLKFIDEVANMMDKIGGGWFYWGYDPSNWSIIDSNRATTVSQKVLERPYPMYIAGDKPIFSWNRNTEIFSFEANWTKDLESKLSNYNTEIYMPNFVWKNGFEIKVLNGKIKWDYNKEKKRLKVTSENYGDFNFEIIPIKK
jgi:endoglycosylceramidase